MDYTENKPNVSANSIERRKRNDTLELFLRKKRSFRESCFVYKKKEKKENARIRKQLNISVLLRSKMGKKRIIHSLQYNWCRENGGCEEIVTTNASLTIFTRTREISISIEFFASDQFAIRVMRTLIHASTSPKGKLLFPFVYVRSFDRETTGRKGTKLERFLSSFTLRWAHKIEWIQKL